MPRGPIHRHVIWRGYVVGMHASRIRVSRGTDDGARDAAHDFSSRLRLGSGWTGSVVVLSCPFKLRDVTHFIASSGQSIQTAKRSMVSGRPRKESAEHQEQLSPRAGNRLQRTAQCSEEKERDEGCKRYAASHRPQHRPTSHPCPNGVRI